MNDYRIIKNKQTQSKYIIFSHTPFYKSNNNDKDIVMKQVNIHPTINYAFLIQYENLLIYA